MADAKFNLQSPRPRCINKIVKQVIIEKKTKLDFL